MNQHFSRDVIRPEHMLPELLARLTPREREVLLHILEARTAKEVARDLGITQRTAEAHIERLRAKLMARSITDILRIVGAAERMGVIGYDVLRAPMAEIVPQRLAG